MQRAAEKKRKQQQHKLDKQKKQKQAGEMSRAALSSASSSSSFGVLAQLDSDEEPVVSTEPAADAASTAAASSSTSAPSSSSSSSSSAAAPSRSVHTPASTFVRPAPNPFVRVKAGNFSRLLYTNPVCLLTTSLPLATPSTTQTPMPVLTPSGNDVAAAATETVPTTTETPVSGADGSSNEAAVASSSSAAFTPAPPLTPSRNVMTISWLTATSNHGEFVCSMNASRFSAKLLARAAAAPSSSSSSAQGSDFIGAHFVLSVPVAGMEALVKAIGGCSGGDAAEDLAVGGAGEAGKMPHDKFARLAIQPCRPGGKPIRQEAPKLSPGAAAAAAGSSSSSKPAQKLSAQDEESLADAEDHALNLLAIPGCAAHLVCMVHSSCPASGASPRVAAHNVLFCTVKRAYVHKDYWINGNNFVHATPHTPPYLTFLGSGNFAHVMNPAFGKKQ